MGSSSHPRAPSLEPKIEIEDLQHQPEGVGPAQPPAGFVAMSVLQDTMVRILSFLEGMSQAGTLPGTPSGPQVRARPVMSPEEWKMLGQFIMLGPPRFSGAPGEDAHEFLGLSRGHVMRPIGVAKRGPAVRVFSMVLSPEVGFSLVEVTLSTFSFAAQFRQPTNYKR
ncbi:hypothetical protein HAX54_052186 [Datura stramonium]|uniref:Uncharacterized protein n=1 Tax=Datura stramonium TaxID=4076 RepID=A0ABS8SYK4_DATST|nr:hypothetical protein [Datura stramonium]